MSAVLLRMPDFSRLVSITASSTTAKHTQQLSVSLPPICVPSALNFSYCTAVMCPDRKTQWFIDREWPAASIDTIRTRARIAFERFRTIALPARDGSFEMAHSTAPARVISSPVSTAGARTTSPSHSASAAISPGSNITPETRIVSVQLSLQTLLYRTNKLLPPLGCSSLPL